MTTNSISLNLLSTYWIDNAGSLIKYAEMNDKYLINAFNLARRTSNRTEHVPYLVNELLKRGYGKSNPELFI